MKDLGEDSFILEVEVHRDRRKGVLDYRKRHP
jgi:hypothetical protein